MLPKPPLPFKRPPIIHSPCPNKRSFSAVPFQRPKRRPGWALIWVGVPPPFADVYDAAMLICPKQPPPSRIVGMVWHLLYGSAESPCNQGDNDFQPLEPTHFSVSKVSVAVQKNCPNGTFWDRDILFILVEKHFHLIFFLVPIGLCCLTTHSIQHPHFSQNPKSTQFQDTRSLGGRT